MVNIYHNKVDKLQAFGERFKDVVIESLDFEEIIKRYDSPSTLFYCDPPYDTKDVGKYRMGWNKTHTKRLVDCIKNLDASIVLTCYFNECYEPLLESGFQSYSVETNVTVVNGERVKGREYILYKDNTQNKIASGNENDTLLF